jgi:hypothetical protein
MRIHCHTNLDLVQEVWPDELPTIAVGHRIQSKTKHGVFQLTLEVVEVTWEYGDYNCYECNVELHDPIRLTRSIRDFYKWYAPLVGRSVDSFI